MCMMSIRREVPSVHKEHVLVESVAKASICKRGASLCNANTRHDLIPFIDTRPSIWQTPDTYSCFSES